MSIWSRYIAKKLVFEHHPLIDEGGCLNAIQTRAPCGACRAACPAGVLDGPEPNWDACVDCNACAAACPTRCIRPSASLAGRVLEACARLTGPVCISCGAGEAPADLKLPCLASYPWELLAFLALGGGVTVLPGPCGDCPDRALLATWKDTLDRLEAFLGPEDHAALVQVAEAGETAPPQRAVSRRDIFSLALSKSKATLAALLPADQDLDPDGSLFRQLLAHRLRQRREAGEAPVLAWTLPAFTDACDACAFCVRLCPSGALKRVEGDGGGRKRWYMALIPWRCTGCGLCAQACPRGGLTAPGPVSLDDPSTPRLHAHRARPCPRCGEPAEGEGLCRRCQGEARGPMTLEV